MDFKSSSKMLDVNIMPRFFKKCHNLYYVTCVLCLVFLVTQAKKVEFKTLDGLINIRLRNGEKRSISSKCAELDREVNVIVNVIVLMQF